MKAIAQKNYAATDPRSVQAMLAGTDDGRGRAFELFRRQALRKAPGLSNEMLDEQYRRALANGWLQQQKRKAVRIFAMCFFYVVAVTAVIWL